MTDSAGARIAVGLGIVALFVVLAAILEQVAGTEEAVPNTSDSATAPTDLQFCVAWRQLVTETSVDRSSEGSHPDSVHEAVVRVRELGFPEEMSPAARSGLLAAIDEIEVRFDPDHAPTAFPAEPAEDAAFSEYLAESCPA